MFEELKEFCFNQTGLIFHLYKKDLSIIANVIRCEKYYSGFMVVIEGGKLIIWPESKITKLPRPSNLVIKCNACYLICSEDNEELGYIFQQNYDTND